MANYNYFLQPLSIPAIELGELAEINAQLVPWHIRGLQMQKSRSFWTTRDDWIAGVKALTIEQERLLMGAKEDIIREIRGVRGSWENLPTDLTSFPVGTWPGVQLQGIEQALTSNASGDSAAKLLEDIKTILSTQATNESGQLEQLIKIAALLAV